ncbi:MAG: AAA family ATPase [Rhizobiales bacterium]|nr:AAA family ATPase [Hyphomicrobiales bacterium]
MSVHAGQSMSAHVIVLGNEKGGSGKSTTAMHVAVALMTMGQRVATVDLDSRQKSFTRYIDNRRTWAAHSGLGLKVPVHFCIARGTTLRLDENEAIEFGGLVEAVASVERSHDFIVIDTPGTDTYLMRLAHSIADTLITPLNDSFVDFDVLGTVDPTTFAVTGESHYADMVRDARRQRRSVDGGHMDWIVVRNRLSTIASRNKQLVGEGLTHLGARLGFRYADGLAERLIYREFFPRGLTAVDQIDEETLGIRPSLAHVTAHEEVMALIAALKLPLDERGKRRAAARAEWAAAQDEPLEMDDIVEN